MACCEDERRKDSSFAFNLLTARIDERVQFKMVMCAIVVTSLVYFIYLVSV